MTCNEMRCLANEIMVKIFLGDFKDNEKIAQLDMLRMYAVAAIKEIKEDHRFKIGERMIDNSELGPKV